MSRHLHLAMPHASRVSAGSALERPVHVVLADDHALMRRSLRGLLESADGIEIAAEASDLDTAIRCVCLHWPQVLVLDLRLPDRSSTEAIHRLRERAPGTEIVVVTMEDGPGFAHHALNAGAIGFVLKHFADDELVPAVRAAALGHEFVSPRIAAGLDSLRSGLLSV